ncbi:hypothetical protein AOQ88_01315 [Candidatus Riesia sp. GBBU]|nr:hypothetical protein AOQ88_01315 [Candidatus Riesia sp. GBBU]
MIRFEKVYYKYNKNKKMKFDFTINNNEKVAIFGKSGSGKSTLLKLISGFQHPNFGKILINKENHTYTLPNKRPVSFLLQENNLFSHLTIWQNISLGISNRFFLNKKEKRKIYEILKKFQLFEYKDHLPSQISGGQRQCASLIRTLIRDKEILLLDEPFSNLDFKLHDKFLKYIKKIQEIKRSILIMVSHNLDDIFKITNRVIVISKGKIIYDGDNISFCKCLKYLHF